MPRSRFPGLYQAKNLLLPSFLMYELQNGFKMTLKPQNNYWFLKHIRLPFQWYIANHYMTKLIFCHFLMYELQNVFKMTLKPKNNYRLLKHKLWAFQWYITCYGMKKLIFVIFDIRASKWFQKSLPNQRVQKVPKLVLKQSKTKVTVYI